MGRPRARDRRPVAPRRGDSPRRTGRWCNRNDDGEHGPDHRPVSDDAAQTKAPQSEQAGDDPGEKTPATEGRCPQRAEARRDQSVGRRANTDGGSPDEHALELEERRKQVCQRGAAQERAGSEASPQGPDAQHDHGEEHREPGEELVHVQAPRSRVTGRTPHHRRPRSRRRSQRRRSGGRGCSCRGSRWRRGCL